ncbi:MAG TPA: hypothetical protein H9805_10165 [Candidatus Janibacter merdipullorum]|nr:hypothetical protein [Candidatus Janibacter merdipullorum]
MDSTSLPFVTNPCNSPCSSPASWILALKSFEQSVKPECHGRPLLIEKPGEPDLLDIRLGNPHEFGRPAAVILKQPRGALEHSLDVIHLDAAGRENRSRVTNSVEDGPVVGAQVHRVITVMTMLFSVMTCTVPLV